MQLILMAKDQGDTGVIVMPSWSIGAGLVGCDRGSLAGLLRKFQQASRITLTVGPGTVQIVTVCNYQHYQRFAKVSRVTGGAEKPAPITRQDKTRLERTLSDKKNPTKKNVDNSKPKKAKKPKAKKPVEPDENKKAHQIIIDWFCKEFEKKTGTKYHVKGGKDGQAVKMLIKHSGPKVVCGMINIMFDQSAPEFWGLSMLWANINRYSVLYHQKLTKLPTPLTAEQEQKHYNSHKNRDGSKTEPKESGDIFSQNPRETETKIAPLLNPKFEGFSDGWLKRELKTAETVQDNNRATAITIEIINRGNQ